MSSCATVTSAVKPRSAKARRALNLVVLLAGVLATVSGTVAASDPSGIGAAEESFLDTLDAGGALASIDSGLWDSFDGRDRAAWQRALESRRGALNADLTRLEAGHLSQSDAAAVAAMRRTLAAQDATVTTDVPAHACADAGLQDLEYAALRGALAGCFTEIGNRLEFESATIDRGSARQLLHVVEGSQRRKAVFDALRPLWSAVNGDGGRDSPYRRLVALAAADGARHGSEIDAAARAAGIDGASLERWLLQVLEAWAEVTGPAMVEPWDYSYVHGEANRRLAAQLPPQALESLNARFYRDLGADLGRLGTVYDLAPRADKSPLAYTEFLRRGRSIDGRWRAPVARVVGTYAQGGLFSLNELIHETGHAVHVSAIRTRPAYMDWPADTLFVEAFADVPSWSVYEPAWQRRYLGAEVPQAVSLRALLGDVMLDVAWAVFELRMLRDPQSDPNVVWTAITSRYLHVVPHPEVAWWAQRVQLVESPGYMVNYGLGAVLTAEMRDGVERGVGRFDAGNPHWYPWLGPHLLQYGSERGTGDLLAALLGRRPTPAALIRLIHRAALH